MKAYNVEGNELIKGFISPDFFIYKIEIEKFNELLKEREYMMKTFKKLNKNIKYVSIIGEIKISHKSAFKNNDQRKDYITFIQKAKATLNEEELVLMYVYDQSYKLFKEDKPKEID